MKQGFVKFIDQNTECLCPIILTNMMLIDFVYENDRITCQIDLSGDKLIAISSNLLLHNLLKIDVEILDENESLTMPSVDLLNHKSFTLNVLNCKFVGQLLKVFLGNCLMIFCKSWYRWFESNIDEVMRHLKNNLFYENETRPGKKHNRNIVLHGLKGITKKYHTIQIKCLNYSNLRFFGNFKGSGKSTICKHICNIVSEKPYNCVYHYINCQNFMSNWIYLFFN